MSTESLADELREPVLECLSLQDEAKLISAKYSDGYLVIRLEANMLFPQDLNELADLFDDKNIGVGAEDDSKFSLWINPGPERKIKDIL